MVAVAARHTLLKYKRIPLDEVLRHPLVLCDPQLCKAAPKRANLLSHIRFQALHDLYERFDTGTFLCREDDYPAIPTDCCGRFDSGFDTDDRQGILGSECGYGSHRCGIARDYECFRSIIDQSIRNFSDAAGNVGRFAVTVRCKP